jgi:hypothetical protein
LLPATAFQHSKLQALFYFPLLPSFKPFTSPLDGSSSLPVMFLFIIFVLFSQSLILALFCDLRIFSSISTSYSSFSISKKKKKNRRLWNMWECCPLEAVNFEEKEIYLLLSMPSQENNITLSLFSSLHQ